MTDPTGEARAAARAVQERRHLLLAEIEFELTGPAAIAAPERRAGETATVRPLARDASGEPWIPPTSLAGSFRAHLPDPVRGELMGHGAPRGGSTEDSLTSRVRFLATELTLPEGGSPVHRTRTAMDARRGAAAAGTLRTAEYLASGTRVRCRLWVHGEEEHHRPVREALRTWRPVIGGGRSTGHGTVRLLALRHAVVDLTTRAGRALWLTHGGPALFTAAGLRPVPLSPANPTASPSAFLPALPWQLTDPLHVGSGERRPTEPSRILLDDTGRPLIPGTAWKGILRARTGYVLRSLDRPACPGMADSCGRCSLCTTFGWTGPDATGARGLLRFPDTPVEDAPPPAVRNHVAIDRFTGGARDGLLYQDEVIESGTFTLTLTLTTDPARQGPAATVPPEARAALVLALWDLHEGLYGLGGGTTRGYGTVRCTDPATLAALRADARKALTP
ncbi:RAMP superfamily CRISPR-associated protein [Streptomyces aidingensis]|uniref:CRISPR/Cas system CSM-associated protein Csm3, group 7 of RAMP superfamily n=1 Tax=Streptomyces aidingensis TaxID=910347 RepID=A0A1I1NIT3_9ACTN|nr:RAMP superfamily CRISPR-associated protein [Streptomyces aidingensis]SFC97336.1 CRISPR/Cas system CSM-associated protein Csm3, group 7 of RAMP superfamily [Streptomyces aidingensis]